MQDISGKLDRFGERVRLRSGSLAPSLRTVATYINENRRAVLDLSALEIAAATGTSDASVIRSIQALGFEGLRDLKLRLREFLGEEPSSPEKMAATVEELRRNVDSTITFVLEGHLRSAETLGNQRNRKAISDAIKILREAGQIALFGINASGVLAEYAARLFVRNGHSAYSLNRTGISLGEQLLTMREGDALIIMIQKRAHREGATVVKEARRLNVPIILLTSSDESAFREDANVVIIVPRGHSGKFPQHSAVLVCLELITLALAATEPEKSALSMERLHAFHGSIRGVMRGT
jgi:DNA-binding MurR/RpiR family transcriptional regulator